MSHRREYLTPNIEFRRIHEYTPGVPSIDGGRVENGAEDVVVVGHPRGRSRALAHARTAGRSSSAVAATGHGRALAARLQAVVAVQNVGEVLHLQTNPQETIGMCKKEETKGIGSVAPHLEADPPLQTLAPTDLRLARLLPKREKLRTSLHEEGKEAEGGGGIRRGREARRPWPGAAPASP